MSYGRRLRKTRSCTTRVSALRSRLGDSERPKTGHELPVAVWRELVAQHFPVSGWLRLDHQTLTMLTAYKASRGLTTYDAAANDLLVAAGEMAR